MIPSSFEDREQRTHQIQLFLRKGKMQVSCNCKRIYGKWNRTMKGGSVFEEMKILPGETLTQTYHRPENHSDSEEPFNAQKGP